MHENVLFQNVPLIQGRFSQRLLRYLYDKIFTSRNSKKKNIHESKSDYMRRIIPQKLRSNLRQLWYVNDPSLLKKPECAALHWQWKSWKWKGEGIGVVTHEKACGIKTPLTRKSKHVKKKQNKESLLPSLRAKRKWGWGVSNSISLKK